MDDIIAGISAPDVSFVAGTPTVITCTVGIIQNTGTFQWRKSGHELSGDFLLTNEPFNFDYQVSKVTLYADYTQNTLTAVTTIFTCSFSSTTLSNKDEDVNANRFRK